jgi:hypothetical protein
MSVPFFTKSDNLQDVVLDLDDFAQEPGNNCLADLMDLKIKYPKLKVTLFAIPYYQGKDNSPFFHMVKEKFGDWIEMAIHGWKHEPVECKEWNHHTAYRLAKKSYDMGCFVKGFKAPGWQISRETYQALHELGFWIADHNTSEYTEKGVPNSERRPKDMKVYSVDHPWIVHGHTWDVNNLDPPYRNGIRQIVEEHGVPWNKDSNFHFISEVV